MTRRRVAGQPSLARTTIAPASLLHAQRRSDGSFEQLSRWLGKVPSATWKRRLSTDAGPDRRAFGFPFPAARLRRSLIVLTTLALSCWALSAATGELEQSPFLAVEPELSTLVPEPYWRRTGRAPRGSTTKGSPPIQNETSTSLTLTRDQEARIRPDSTALTPAFGRWTETARQSPIRCAVERVITTSATSSALRVGVAPLARRRAPPCCPRVPSR